MLSRFPIAMSFDWLPGRRAWAATAACQHTPHGVCNDIRPKKSKNVGTDVFFQVFFLWLGGINPRLIVPHIGGGTNLRKRQIWTGNKIIPSIIYLGIYMQHTVKFQYVKLSVSSKVMI